MTAPRVPAPIRALRDAGVSIWLDDLSRACIDNGALARMIDTRGVVGVTTNPTIFAGALDDDAYFDQLREMARTDAEAEDAVNHLTTDDVRDAADVLRRVYDAGNGQDGRVTVEVDPSLADDIAGTVQAARHLWDTVNRPNILIQIPATDAGLTAITRTLSLGISVNVTLVFSPDRYARVMAAFCHGLEAAWDNGRDLKTMASVASFFVSRVDTAVDAALAAVGTPEALALRGQAALANARAAFAAYEQFHAGRRFQALVRLGAHPQRPLFASISVKNPAYHDTRYVEELVTDGVVITMPRATLDAVADHAVIRGDTIRPLAGDAQRILARIEGAGVSMSAITARLEAEGMHAFAASWENLITSTSGALRRAHSGLTP